MTDPHATVVLLADRLFAALKGPAPIADATHAARLAGLDPTAARLVADDLVARALNTHPARRAALANDVAHDAIAPPAD